YRHWFRYIARQTRTRYCSSYQSKNPEPIVSWNSRKFCSNIRARRVRAPVPCRRHSRQTENRLDGARRRSRSQRSRRCHRRTSRSRERQKKEKCGVTHTVGPAQAVRVIAGTAGGLQLKVPRSGVRPTMDRVKAAIFSSLGEKVIGARILDLFAGAGGLGIEAMSRGAASAVFVESNRNAARIIERNLAIADVDGRVRVRDVFAYLKYATGPFDIIFADPPYEAAPGAKSFTDLLLNNPKIPRLLVPDGVLVLEKRPGEKVPEHPRSEERRVGKESRSEWSRR